MSTTTPTIGLKKPEGSDPFLTEDFASNYDKIDAAFAARPPGGGSGSSSGGDAATLQGHPASFFYSSANPPPTGAGGSTTDAATLQGHPASYFAVAGSTDAATLQSHPASYFYSPGNPPPPSGGGSYTPPTDLVESPGRTNPKIVYSTIGYSLNGINAATVTFSFGYTFGSTPVVVATPLQGSDIDMTCNLQGIVNSNASCRMAQSDHVAVTTTGTLQWIAVGT
jgi:hypothetical protein